jgi:hypothetical protein
MKKLLVISLVTLFVGFIGFYIYCRNFAYNENYLQLAKDATTPNMNFLFARNASLVGRVYMTFSGKEFKPCINTATAFFNNFDTCSNCEDFVKNPARWRFQKVDVPQVGDIIIQHNSKTGKAYHAAMIVDIRNGKYIVNHAVRRNYIKNAELKNTSNLTFYRFVIKSM